MALHEWRALNNIDRDCFGCGQHNPQGLRMTFATNGEQLRSQLVIPEHLRGWSHLVHGGVTTTMLDEMMGWAGIYFLNKFLLTRDIKVRFRLPVFVGETVTVVGYVSEHSSDKRAVLAAELYKSKGQLAAKAEGDFALFEPQRFAELNLVPADKLEQMQAMFRIHQHWHREEEAGV